MIRTSASGDTITYSTKTRGAHILRRAMINQRRSDNALVNKSIALGLGRLERRADNAIAESNPEFVAYARRIEYVNAMKYRIADYWATRDGLGRLENRAANLMWGGD